MKKLFSLILALALALLTCSAAMATPFYLEAAGVTIDVPDGMTAQDMSDETGYALGIAVDGNESLYYVYALYYSEDLAGYYLNDLTDEEGQQLLDELAGMIPNPEYGAAEVNGYPVLVAASGDGTQLHYISLLNGWICDVAAVKSDGVMLADDEIEAAAYLIYSIEFDDQ